MEEKITITFTGTKEMNERLKRFKTFRRQKSKVVKKLLEKLLHDLNDEEICLLLNRFFSTKIILVEE